jgi:hypothetical protein
MTHYKQRAIFIVSFFPLVPFGYFLFISRHKIAALGVVGDAG